MASTRLLYEEWVSLGALSHTAVSSRAVLCAGRWSSTELQKLLAGHTIQQSCASSR